MNVFERVDAFILGWIFQPVADWLAARTGKNCFWYAGHAITLTALAYGFGAALLVKAAVETQSLGDSTVAVFSLATGTYILFMSVRAYRHVKLLHDYQSGQNPDRHNAPARLIAVSWLVMLLYMNYLSGHVRPVDAMFILSMVSQVVALYFMACNTPPRIVVRKPAAVPQTA